MRSFIQILLLVKCTQSFAFSPSWNQGYDAGTIHKMSSSPLHMSLRDESQERSSTLPPPPFKAFPVISRIAGIEWTGECRYVGADLVPASQLELSGGVKYDINGTTVTLSSFLTFPNGKTREVVMQGDKDISSTSTSMILRAVEEGGPISMKITELAPDTILINEVEEATGKTILTASVSLVKGSKGMELVQVSHEVSDGGKDVIEGHQVRRLSGGSIKFDDFDLRHGTGW
jgi:hypothetical protein